MLIRPELQALRSDDAPQRSAQDSFRRLLEAWRAAPSGAAAEAELARFHHGAPLADLPLLADLFCPDSEQWRRFLDSLLCPLLSQIAAQPLSQSPLRYVTNDAFTSLVLARCGTTALTLHNVSGVGLATRPAPLSASFLPTETWKRVLAGTAQATQVRTGQVSPDRAELVQTPCRLGPGHVQCRHGQREALILQAVPTSLVQLRLQRRTSMTSPMREYRLSDSQLIHQAAGTPRDSRLELTVNLLGRMKRRDADPMLAAMAQEQGSDSLRWQALRECLALDTETGFRNLCALAEKADDPLHRPAAALRQKLLQLHPELNGICPCPA